MEATEFFAGSRIEVKISHPEGLMSKSDERRMKFRMTTELIEGQSLQGMPDWVLEAWGQVGKPALGIASVGFTHVLEGMNATFYPLEESEDHILALPNVKFNNFEVRRDGISTDAPIVLAWIAHVAHSASAWKHIGSLHGGTLFARFDAQQLELRMEPTAAPPSDEEVSGTHPEALASVDEEIAANKKTEGIPQTLAGARKPRGFGRPTNPSVM